MQATISNCQTGAVTESFPKLITFMQGGTMQESSASLAGFLRTSGHGVWSRGRGRTYSYALQFFRFNANNTYAGLVRARWQVQLDTIGNHYTATGAIEIFNPAGILVANLCGAETATRFE